MFLSDLSIKRPVLATVASLIIALLGLIAFNRIPVREFPKTDNPVVSVDTSYKGADAEIIESQITQVLEDTLSGIEGIDYMTSNSRPEKSEISLIFKLNRDPDSAAADVRDHISRTLSQLPQGIDAPVIQKVEADARPFIFLGLTSNKLSDMELYDYGERYIKDRLQNQPGVASVIMVPDRRPSMRIWLDPVRLAAYHMTTQDVEDALRKQNLEIPSGRIESAMREFTVLSETDLRTPAQFNNIILRNEKGYLIRLSDIGRAEIAPADTRGFARLNGKPAMAFGIIKQATANPVDVSDAIHQQLAKIQPTLPADLHIIMSHDGAEFIRASIANVYKTLAEAAVLVILIIFLFLRSFKATFIPLVTIPLAILGSFSLIYAFSFSINTLTLLALVLAIGLVVDDAIVMLENIYRHVESGMPAREAAFKGSREIGFAIIAMTITLAAVYIPIGFMTGKTGKLFTEFAWTLAGAVLISGFVALTLSPMMCSKFIHHETRHGKLYNFFENIITSIGNAYQRGLKRSLNSRRAIAFAGIAIALCGAFFFKVLHSELAPTEDQGKFLGIFMGPEGSSTEYMQGYAKRIEGIFHSTHEVTNYFVVTGFPDTTSGISFVHFKPWSERKRSQQEIVGEVGPKMFGIPGILAFPINPPPLGQSPFTQSVQLVIQTSGSFGELQKMVDAVMAKAARHPGLTNLDSDLKLNKPRINISVNRDKLADLGISVDTVGRTLETLFGGRKVTRYKDRGKQYDVVVELRDQDRRNPADLTRAYLRASNGEMVQLSNLVDVKETIAAKGLSHFNKLRSATIKANLAPGHSLDEELAYLQSVAHETLPASAQIDYTGQTREYLESTGGIYTTFALAMIFIYLVLAAQFESFIHPFIIMLTVPLSITGALLALYLTGGTLNIYSQVGLITLAGLITKHGILIVEFANQIRATGKSVIDAVSEAASLRLRPILMTTGAMTLSALPLALATGAGAESRRQIGLVIVGGLLVGTFFTLFVIPVAYSLIVGYQEKRSRKATLIR